MKRTLMFLGHIISAQGISVDPCKVTAISNWPVPTSLKTLQSFLGAANYVRKFVHNFSTIAAPLTNLTGPKKESFPWKAWPQAELDAFNALKQAIANVPMLKLPDHSKPFQVHCDASLEGIGAVLMQDGYPLAYYSRKLIPAEINYTTGEQELLALVSACQQWRPPTKRVTWAADVPADGEPSAPKPPGPLSNLHEWLVRAYAADSNFTKRRKTKNYYLDDNGLWRHNKRRTVIVPRDKQLREHILHEMHDAKYAGHVGITKTLERVMRVFWKSSDSVFQVGDRVLLSTMNLRNMVGKARKLLPRAISEWKKVTYTDGSCIKGTEGASVGAGVYTPASDDRITIALTGDTTINRAELIAILSALLAGAKRIATDSLCSLYQIRRALANPMSLRTHRHKDILAEIATILTNSQDTVHFFKVRAHSGIIGNEGADALAKHAARHPEQATTRGPCSPRHTEQHAWLSTTSELNVTTPLPDCRHSVRAHMSNKHKLGLANQESIYYQMSREITKVAAKGSRERVMTDAGIPTEAQRTALLYRTGGLYNQKLAMRWGKAADDRCPLCGEADSATHLLSGCSRTAALVQERHNGAGRLIMKAISKGAQGGCMKFADIGSHERGETKGIDLPSTTLRKALEDLSLSARDTNTTTRPDIIMINNTKKRKQGSNESTKHVTLLEIKYCADSRWAEQLDNATTQHAAMAEAIIAAGHTVTIRPILLGIGGIAYNTHNKLHMEAIGITQTNTTKLLNKLTRHAVISSHSIARTSYRLRAGVKDGG
ncbi:hypothetical protein QJQ45_000821 [Haematococcus lacustris]|nr:hypothetical protein QJQ45_000821 [Haematococcus lacustris]